MPAEARSQVVTSSQLLFNFTFSRKNLNILSVLNNKILVGFAGDITHLLVITESLDRSFIQINEDERPLDAIWTPHGNIACATINNADLSVKVVVMSESGKVIVTHNEMKNAGHFSVSNDEKIYFADSLTGVYMSTDDGINWSIILKPPAEYSILQAIKVTSHNTDDYWLLSQEIGFEGQAFLHIVNRTHTDGVSERNLIQFAEGKIRSESNVTWKNINVATTDGTKIELLNSMLVSDGNMNIFLNEFENQTIHVLLANGQYHCQLLSTLDTDEQMKRIALNRKRQLLYVGQTNGIVKVYKLKYR